MQTTDQLTTVETAKKLGLLPEEFERIKEILGRTPNFTELSIFSVMWSEHCSYKNSIVWLKTLPREGAGMLAKAGEENAGLVDIGKGYACAFKIESHNHPSALEPYQGAATGVGGINRDIFTMGARPVAQLNSLRFGNLKLDKTRWLLKGVVKGIGDYGNAFGIPVLGGEVFFDPCYNENPLVNAMSVGIVKVGETASATSYGAGNHVYIVGSSTGKDGIHGATFASGDLNEESAKDLPAVQVGDPFQEKLLLEATLEVIKTGAIIGMQDMGAAGITCSTSEMSAKGEHGMNIWLDKVPTRQEGMQAWEILLSESQERMLMVVEAGREAEVEAVFDKWDLHHAIIGEVIEGGRLKYYMKGELVADVPANDLVLGGGAPIYHREYKEPAYFSETKKFDINSIPEPDNLKEIALHLLGHPNIASKRWVYDQYDSMVGTANISTNKPADAGLLYLKDTGKVLAMTVDCNARYVHADPETGASIAVAEAARNLVCSGAKPLGVTNCLNFGNPYNPEVYWQFVGAIKGMGAACRAFDTPVTGGNVSFYNQTVLDNSTVPVFPTPTIGMIGLMDSPEEAMGLGFESAGDLIFMLGSSRNDISSSQYLSSWHKVALSPAPAFNINDELVLQAALATLTKGKLIESAHDVSDGGLFVTLAESGFVNSLGCDIQSEQGIRNDAFLFGEAQGRVVVSVKPAKLEAFKTALEQHSSLTFKQLGHVSSAEVKVDDISFGQIKNLFGLYNNALTNIMHEQL
ncbi:MAG: phosphoribosylformylglycinamidine synthase subunit PurL [Bacteroidia bacterium]|nr:phosphoribosylformylglycinamidine synthase subunit PurL [Bacteroidia bacterium]